MKVFCHECHHSIYCTAALKNVIVGFGSHFETSWTFWLRIRIEGRPNRSNIDLY
jgi:hypothetical protein